MFNSNDTEDSEFDAQKYATIAKAESGHSSGTPAAWLSDNMLKVEESNLLDKLNGPPYGLLAENIYSSCSFAIVKASETTYKYQVKVDQHGEASISTATIRIRSNVLPYFKAFKRII